MLPSRLLGLPMVDVLVLCSKGIMRYVRFLKNFKRIMSHVCRGACVCACTRPW